MMKKAEYLVLSQILMVSSCKRKDPTPEIKHTEDVEINHVLMPVGYEGNIRFINGKVELSVGFAHGYIVEGEGCYDLASGFSDTLDNDHFVGLRDMKSLNLPYFEYFDCDVPICSYNKLDTGYAGNFLNIKALDTAAKTITYSFAAKFSLTAGRYCAANRPDSVLVEGGPVTAPLEVQVVK